VTGQTAIDGRSPEPRPRGRTGDSGIPRRCKWKTRVRGFVTDLSGHGRSKRAKR
jgi:hypothetical protein